MSGGIAVFGEVLFDHFPDGSRVLGGAPFNVAWHLQAFGADPLFISRVGSDAEGDEILSAMQRWGMRTEQVQIDDELPTGRVFVTFSESGEPTYEIVHPCAYDAMLPVQSIDCSLLYHGSLALRSGASLQTLEMLRLQSAAMVFVDVNLRPPWWQREQVLKLVKCADWVKINGDELAELEPEATAQLFINEQMLHGLILTHGAAGAEVVMAAGDKVDVVPERSVPVVDSVGAGDAFASVMLLGLAQGWPLSITAERAQQFASTIVGVRGATVSDRSFYQPFIDEWKIDL